MLFWIILIAFGLPILGFLFQMKKQRKLHENKFASIQSKLAEIERRFSRAFVTTRRPQVRALRL